jgi:drug/metabolite transporter (DMT)-like permease
VASFPPRRWAASPVPIPPQIWAVLAFLGAMVFVLLSNIVAPRGEFAAGIYSLGVTGILLGGVMFFLFSLILFFGPHPIDHLGDARDTGKGRRRTRKRSR